MVRRLITTLLTALVVTAIAPVMAQSGGNSVFGLSEAAFTEKFQGFLCKDTDGGAKMRADRGCGIEAPFIPDVPARMLVLFKQDKLIASVVQIDTGNLEKTIQHLIAKYGLPDGREVKGDNEVSYWYDGTRLLAVSKTAPETPRGKSLVVSSIEEKIIADAKKLVGQKKAAAGQSYDALLGGSPVAPRNAGAGVPEQSASSPPNASTARAPADELRGRYVTESELRQQKQSAAEAKKSEESVKLTAALEALRGKTFWYRPNREPAIFPIEFLEPGKSGRAPVPYKETANRFFVTAETSFVVLDYERLNEKSAFEHYFLRLEFPGGKTGYLAVPLAPSGRFDGQPLIKLYPGKESASSYEEYIFPQPPQEILAAEEKAAAKQAAEQKARDDKAAAEHKARGGVKIGMTANQVLKSNWGKPFNVNRTITPNGTHEQWVYGGGNYLYFDRGILTAIQN